MRGDRYGAHRVLEPAGALPQAAWRLDADPERRFDDELLIDVELLNVDSASFAQLEAEAAGDPARIGELIARTVRERGKQHNPATGSGGMLLGRVARVGPLHPAAGRLRPGDRLATLVSLTLTPLRLARILEVRPRAHQVAVEGQAILFESGAFALLPDDLPEAVALAALDVAGAAPQVERLAAPGALVVILGAGGKSGLLCARAARGRGAEVIGVERSPAGLEAVRRAGACQRLLQGDAAAPRALAAAVEAAAGRLADLTVSCVNVPDAEMGAILCTRDGGRVYFFSMATSFTQAALGAEGLSRDVELLIGNGYCPGHAERTLALLRGDAALRAIFEERYG